jgi:hypothetical protein
MLCTTRNIHANLSDKLEFIVDFLRQETRLVEIYLQDMILHHIEEVGHVA